MTGLKKYFLIIGGSALVVAAIFILISALPQVSKIFSNQEMDQDINSASVTDFDSCVAAGNPVMESYPRQCRDKQGKLHTEDIGNELELNSEIQIENPRPNQKVQNPLTILGRARGFWYFEAVFNASLVDDKGVKLGECILTAQDEWMTEEFVPFKCDLDFQASEDAKANLYIFKNNPSALPEFDKTLRIPVKLK